MISYGKSTVKMIPRTSVKSMKKAIRQKFQVPPSDWPALNFLLHDGTDEIQLDDEDDISGCDPATFKIVVRVRGDSDDDDESLLPALTTAGPAAKKDRTGLVATVTFAGGPHQITLRIIQSR
jgi:hypothetical protein